MLHFGDLVSYFWQRRKVFYWCVGIFLAGGILLAVFSPKEYKTGASIIPEYELQDRVNEVIGNYGLLFGLTGSIQEKRTPSYLLELYPYMINSIAFKQSLIHQPFHYQKRDTTITLYDYFTKFYHPSVMATIHKYTLGLPGTLMSEADTNVAGVSDPMVADSLGKDALGPEFNVLHLSRAEKRVIHQLSGRITASYTRRTGIVKLQTKMPEANLTAVVAQLTLKVLHQKAVAYKTEKGRVYQQFLETQLDRARKELDNARSTLTNFKGRKKQLLDKRMELQSNYEEALDQYNTINRQLSLITLDIQEQLPAFRILDDITVPNQKSEPRRKLIIMFSLLLGICVALCWVSAAFVTSKMERPSAAG